jgi:hypothetical protein
MKRVAAYSVLAAALAALVTGIMIWHPWEKRRKTPINVYEIPPREDPSGRSHIQAQAVTGTLTIHSNVPDAEVFVDAKRYTAPKGATELTLTLPPATYIVRAIHPGFDESSPVVGSVLTGINRDVHVFLPPKSISPEALREERQDWERATKIRTRLSLEDFLRKHPGTLYTPAADEMMQDIQWPYIDQNDPQVLEAFLAKYPNGPHSRQARERLEILHGNETARSLEQYDWVAANKSDKADLTKYLAKYPGGAHAAQARRFISALDSWSAAALQQQSQTQRR